ncbi:MAG: hypothetical protein J6Z12_04875, partial [Paludibacteraceae bacterium]|nr:hypothetical protein [Paludibacteraceae bacterium]
WVNFDYVDVAPDGSLSSCTPVDAVSPWRAFGQSGYIGVESETPCQLQVYTLSGRLLGRIKVEQGVFQFPAGRGVYLLTDGAGSAKVQVP